MVHEKIPETQMSSNQIKTIQNQPNCILAQKKGTWQATAQFVWFTNFLQNTQLRFVVPFCRAAPTRPPGVSDWANPSALFLVTAFDLELK